MEDAKIHSKRGVWYVTRPDHPVRRFKSEKDAMAFVEGSVKPKKPVKSKKNDNDWSKLV